MKISGKIFLAFFCLSFSFISCLYASSGDIIIYGDSQNNFEVQRRLVQTIQSFNPAIVFRVGDIVDNGKDPECWKTFNDIHGPLLKTTEYFPVLGNHENDSPLYFKNFRFLHNQRWYSINRLGIHFVILDSNSRLDLESEQYKWLESDLAAVGDLIQFVIVIFHHPLFDVSEGHRSDEKKLKFILLPLFEQYGVSAVFSGHSHDYQQFEYNGMFFIVTGGGGASLDNQSRTDPYLQKFSLTYHFCLLTQKNGFLRVRVIDINSNIIDGFNIPARVDKCAIH
ncbi:MAG: metallophosphoesterase [Candidatus Omnitrophica bacterium]|nr:metallophosphoesterase [Candidatus Omnitrophota bacterium]